MKLTAMKVFIVLFSVTTLVDSCSFASEDDLNGVFIGDAIWGQRWGAGLWTTTDENILQAKLYRYDNDGLSAASTVLASIDLLSGLVTAGQPTHPLTANQPDVIQPDPTAGIDLLLLGGATAVLSKDGVIVVDFPLVQPSSPIGDYFYFATNNTVYIIYETGTSSTPMGMAVNLDADIVEPWLLDTRQIPAWGLHKVYRVYPELQMIAMDDEDSCGERTTYFYNSSGVQPVGLPHSGRAFAIREKPEDVTYFRARNFKAGSLNVFSAPPVAYTVEEVEMLTGRVLRSVHLRGDLIMKIAGFELSETLSGVVLEEVVFDPYESTENVTKEPLDFNDQINDAKSASAMTFTGFSVVWNLFLLLVLQNVEL